MKPNFGDFNIARLKIKSIRRKSKIFAASLMIVFIAGGIFLTNLFNTSSATWNNLTTWSSKVDFDTNTVSAGLTGIAPAATAQTLVDTSTVSGSVKLVKPGDSGYAIAAGTYASYIVKNDGTLWATGHNYYGGLGAGDYGGRDSFTQVATDVSSVSAGIYSAMIIKKDGTLWATGYNGYGGLGLGDVAHRTSFVQTSLNNVKQVSVGTYHSIALKNDGTVWVAGQNTEYQGGFGDTTQRNSWTQVTNSNILKSGNNQATYVFAGVYSTYVVKSDGTVWVTGRNANGQLGLGDTTIRSVWTQASALSNISKISSIGSNVLALKSDGTVWAAGSNASGSLGIGNSIQTNSWVQSSIAGVTDIAAGSSHSLAVKADGSLWVCGSAVSGQLGFGGPTRLSWVSGNINNVSEVAAGNAHSIIRKIDNSTQLSGSNQYGELGTGDKLYYSSWQENPLTSASKVFSGRQSQFVVTSDGSLWATGYGGNGQLGLGDSGNRFSFQKTTMTSVAKVAVGMNSTLALKSDGTVWATGYNVLGSLGTGDTVTKLIWTQVFTGATDISISYNSSLLVKSDGTAWATGVNSTGQLGLGDLVQRNSWTQIPGIAGASKVSAGEAHSLIVTTNGDLYAAGTGSFGQQFLGSGSLTTKTSFTKSAVINGVANIWAGSGNSFLQKNDGTVWVAGANTWGSLGTGDYATKNNPTQLAALTGAADISNGVYSSFILKADGSLWAAGVSFYGEVPRGTVYSLSNTFSQFTTGVAAAVNGGQNNSIMLGTDGKLYTAGYNLYGGVGIPANNDYFQFGFSNSLTNVKKSNGYYATGTISGFKINAGAGNVYKWNTLSWSNDALPANTSIKFRTRSAASEAGLAAASWSNYYTVSGSSISSASSQYLELEVTLGTSDGLNTPTLNDFSINYFSDVTAPTNVVGANVSAWSNSQKNNPINNSSYKNYNQPYFNFSGATDEVDGSGVAGYYVYFGSSNSADPLTAGVYQAQNPLGDPQIFSPAQVISSDGTYYLRVTTIDNAGNKSEPATVFTYNYDKTAPTNSSLVTASPSGWSSTDSFIFSWNASYDEANYASGMAGYQYKLGGTSDDWSGTVYTTQSLSVSNIQSYQNGQNTFFVRSIDNAGNVSGVAQTYFYFNGAAPSAPTNLVVTPQSSDTNSFTFEWDMPTTYNQGIKGYRYSINTMPQGNNTTFINLKGSSLPPEVTYNQQTGHVKLSDIPAATIQGSNIFYLVAVDDGDQVSYNMRNIVSVGFECNTPAPGAPLNVEIFDTSNRDMVKYSATIGWTEPTDKGVGFKEYDIERSTDGNNFALVGSSAGTSFVDMGLSSQLYYYRVFSRDNSNNSSTSSEIVSITPTGSYKTAPLIIVQPAVTAKVSTAQVTWVTDRIATSFVEFGESVNYGLEQGKQGGEKVTDHLVDLAGLKPETVYYFRVGFIDPDGNTGYSPSGTFKTQPAPRIERVSIQDVRLYTALLTWYTSEPATSDLLYGKSTNYSGELDNVSGGATTVHSVLLTNLDHSSTYHFAVRITDLDGNKVLSDDYTFDTLQYPKVFDIRFQPVTDQPTSTFKVTWSSNVPTTSVVEYQPENQKIQEAVKTKLELQHEIVITGLMDNTYYLMNIVGVDQYGNQAISDRQRIKTSFDTRPPILSQPVSEVSSSGSGSDAKAQMVIYWDTDEPATSQVEYGLGVTGANYDMRSQEDATLTTSHVVIVTGLSPSSAYHIRAVSKDAADNKGLSEPVSIITDQARSSIFDVIINSLQSSIGWIFNIGK